MDKVIFSLGGYLVGFIVSTLIWGKTEGAIGFIPNLRIPLGTKELLLHHSLYTYQQFHTPYLLPWSRQLSQQYLLF